MLSTMIIMEEPVETTSKSERDFVDFMQHGDDFFKIELWRPARAWYQKALELGIETERVQRKIAECNRGIAFEVKVIWILVAIAAVIVLAIWILKRFDA